MKLKKVLLFSITFSIWLFPVIAQNQAPVVENVTFSQRNDGSFLVDIYYDVNDPDGDELEITMEVSADNGVTWDFPANNITGDVGSGISSGTNKHIVWDFGAEHLQTFGDQFRIKIISDDLSGGDPCPSSVTYDGKLYNTVLIGDQCWLKENLDVGTMIQGSEEMTDNGIIEKYCYDNDPNNCNTYGGLYQWNETMQYNTTPGVQGICPSGWHIPTLSEFETLKNAVGGDGNTLKEIGQGTGGGAGTNTSGFSALLAGVRVSNGSFDWGGTTYFWSSTEGGANGAGGLYLDSSGSAIRLYYPNKAGGFSVRCLKD